MAASTENNHNSTTSPQMSSQSHQNDHSEQPAEKTVYDELLEFLQAPRRPDLRLEAVKAVLQCVSSDRDEALKLVQDYNVVVPLLKIVSAGTYTEKTPATDDDDDDNSANKSPGQLAASAAEVALQTLLYLTSSTEQLVNLCTDKLLDTQTTNAAVPRLVEYVLTLPPINNDKNNRRINLALALLANLSRTEPGALALTGFALPEEAVYNNDNDGEAGSSNNNKTRVKPTMELLLDRFLNPTLMDVENQEIVDYTMLEPHEWDGLYYDPYQHFAAVLMNITQTEAGRQFLLRIPKDDAGTTGSKLDQVGEEAETESSSDPSSSSNKPSQPSVFERLIPILRTNTNDERYKILARNPLRRRGISGLIRNVICLSPDSVWWLMNVVQIVTPLLLPLAGPEELDWDDKKGMDPDLWLNGPDQIRDVDVVTRQHCVESILLLCAAGRKARETLRLARTYVILRQADMVEESESVSERISECVNFLRRDEEGTKDGSSDQRVAEAYAGGDGKVRLAIEAGPSTCVNMGNGNEDDFDGVD
mmetsp:Transcript_14852/g.36366  ORF Transcript_14852/g.36366 Transcript_14852/m.36366 type:complete len:534 (-) Transcript_14852:4426-6027(-)